MQALKNVYIRPLMPPPRLAARQHRMMVGMLGDGMSMDEIRWFMWYDVKLEALYPVHTPVHAVHTEVSVNTADEAGEDGLAKRKAYRKQWMAEKRAAKKASA